MAPLIRRCAAPSPRKRGEGPPRRPLIRRCAAPPPRERGEGPPVLSPRALQVVAVRAAGVDAEELAEGAGDVERRGLARAAGLVAVGDAFPPQDDRDALVVGDGLAVR